MQTSPIERPERGRKEGQMAFSPEFPASERGLLPAGTTTSHGVIVDRSFTAYEMEDGTYVSFEAIHGRPAAARPLVVFG